MEGKRKNMSVSELKNKIIDKIHHADEKLLQEILDWLAFESDEKIYTTNEAEKNIINEAEEQIKSGKSYSNEQINKETNLWLEE